MLMASLTWIVNAEIQTSPLKWWLARHKTYTLLPRDSSFDLLSLGKLTVILLLLVTCSMHLISSLTVEPCSALVDTPAHPQKLL